MKYVALLRGINVGGNNKLSMKELKKTFEALGLSEVSTYINSGNIIFTDTERSSEKLARKIENGIKKHFRLDVKVLVRDATNIKMVSKGIPSSWKNDTEQKTDVLFLWDKFDKKSSVDLIKTNAAVDSLKYIAGAIVWNVERMNYNKSGMKKFIGTEVYKHMTARNVNTVRKLADLMA